MNTKTILIILVALGFFAFLSLNQSGDKAATNTANVKLQEPGIRVAGSTISVGQGSSEFRQLISYSAVLQNVETSPVYIESAETLLAPDIKARITEGDLFLKVEEEIPSGGTIELDGQIEFNSEALSKKDIDAMGQLVTGFRINSYSIAAVAGQ